jgi:transposase
MRGPRAIALQVSPAQHAALQHLLRQQTADQRLVRRAAILLALAADPCIEAVARRLGTTRLTVRTWRDRWHAAAADLARAERGPSPRPLRALLEQVLGDAPRPGAPATFGPEQIVRIVAVAGEPPGQSDRPIDHWTDRELADEVKKRQIVAGISPRSVGRFLKGGRPAAAPEPLLAQCQARGPRGLRPAGGRGLRAVRAGRGARRAGDPPRQHGREDGDPGAGATAPGHPAGAGPGAAAGV